MAIDTLDKRRCVAGNSPTPDGDISSYFDRRHIAGNYRGMALPVGLSGGITPTGALGHVLTAYRGFGGALTPSGALGRVLTAYRALGGTITPTGALGTIFIIVISLSGEVVMYGELTGRNPAWLLVDEDLRWMGEWSETYPYDQHDTVLYKAETDTEWHVFTSKAGHNTGNNPDSSAAWWRRVYQEQWR